MKILGVIIVLLFYFAYSQLSVSVSDIIGLMCMRMQIQWMYTSVIWVAI